MYYQTQPVWWAADAMTSKAHDSLANAACWSGANKEAGLAQISEVRNQHVVKAPTAESFGLNVNQ